MNRHKIYTNFLPQGLFSAMKHSLPPMEQVPNSGRSHKDLFYEDKLFQDLEKYRPSWKTFLDWWIFNHETWLKLLEDVTYDDSVMRFDPRALPFRKHVAESDRGLRTDDSDPFLYPRIDIGYGVEGYGLHNGGCGPHIDFPQRVISLLLYFSDNVDIEGGEFVIHTNGKNGPLKQVSVKPNMAVAMLQDEWGWHHVNPVTKATEPRIAVYAALSCSHNIWKNR